MVVAAAAAQLHLLCHSEGFASSESSHCTSVATALCGPAHSSALCYPVFTSSESRT